LPDSFEFCFDGLPIGGVFALTANCFSKDEYPLFLDGFKEFLARCQPDTVLVYGRGLKGILEQLHPDIRRFDSRLTQIRKLKETSHENAV
jgi:hypothetical protein